MLTEAEDRQSEGFDGLYLRRLRVQGPDHPATVATLRNLLLHELKREGSCSPLRAGLGATRVDLPEGSSPDDVHLDGDHVDAHIEVQQLAIELQEHRVQALGPEHPGTMISTCYLAHTLAVADHLGGDLGQLQSAKVLAQDAHDGIEDAAEERTGQVGPHDLETARLILRWVHAKLDEPDW